MSEEAGPANGTGMLMRPFRAAAIVALAMLATGSAAPAQPAQTPVVLITDAEAGLPPWPDVALTTRAGVTRGPKIVMVSSAALSGVKSPFHLKFKLETFGGAKVDPSSVKVIYLKNPSVDLTSRFGTIAQGDHIELVAAEAPVGVHHIRVNVKDSEGRSGSAHFALKVLP
jgi:hypothetical protein